MGPPDIGERGHPLRADKKRVVINADDFGLAVGVNRGIIAAHEAGAVTSASLLVNLPAFRDAVRRAEQAPALGVGLHVNLTCGRPVAGRDAVPTLCDPSTGRFHSLGRLVHYALRGLIAADQVMIECAAQVARFRNSGLALTHSDSHRHVHLLPGIRRPFLEAMRRLGVPVVRVPLEPLGRTVGAWGAFAEQLALRVLYRLGARRNDTLPVSAFRGSSLFDRHDFRNRLLRIIDSLDAGATELMVHPGYDDPGALAWDRYTWQRERELRGLLDPAVLDRLRRGDVELVHFGTLTAPSTPTSRAPRITRSAVRFSVVIPAYNEARYLPRLLDSVDIARTVYGAGPGAIEVVLADNGSTDTTTAIAATRGCRLTTQPKRVIAAVRNAGAAAARGEVLVFIDADSVLHPNTFEAIDRSLDEHVIGGATGVTMERWSAGIALLFAAQEAAAIATGWDTGAVFCRRAAFEAAGGFDERVAYGEDFALYLTLRRLARASGQRFVRLRGVRAVTSTRKFDQFGSLRWPLTNLAVLGLSAVRSCRARSLIERYWYQVRT